MQINHVSCPPLRMGATALAVLLFLSLSLRAQPAPDVALKAMQGEVAAKAKEREEMLVKIRAQDAQFPRARVVSPINARIQGQRLVEVVQSIEETHDEFERRRVVLTRAVPVFTEQAFDLWFFGELGTRPNRESAEAHLSRLLSRLVDDAARQFDLNASQRTRLTLAGRGDIKRLLDELEEKRRHWNERRMDLLGGSAFLNASEALRVAIQSGKFDEGSLYDKVLLRIRREKRARARVD